MKKIALLLVLLVFGCKTPNPIIQEKEVIRTEKEILRDTYIDRVLKVMMSEIYSDHTTTLIMDNVKNLYDELRNDYFKRMLE